MASGTINGSTNNQYIDAKIVWSSKPNQATNSSEVTAALYYKRNNTGFTTYGTGKFNILIGGSGTSSTKEISIGTDWVKAVETTQTFKHNLDGTKSVTISASGSISGTTLSSTSCSATVDLDTFPRGATATSLTCSTGDFTGEFTFKYLSHVASFYNRCTISVSGNIGGTKTHVKTINLGQKSNNQTTTVTLTDSELSTIYNALPNSNNGYIYFTISTYSDSAYSSKVGDDSDRSLKPYIPETTATKPTVTVSTSPVSSLQSPFNSLYINGRSKIKATPTASGKYGATIANIGVEIDGVICDSASSYTSGYISHSGSVTVKVTAKDSRGFTNSITKSITALDYSKPRVAPADGESGIVCARCDENGNLTSSGTYLKIKAKRSYSKLMSGDTQNNFCVIKYRKKVSGASYGSWVTVLPETPVTSDEYDSTPLDDIVPSTTTTYVVEIGVEDRMGNMHSVEVVVPTDAVDFHLRRGGNGAAFGKYAERENLLDIFWQTRFLGGVMATEIYDGTDFNDLTTQNTYVGYYAGVSSYANSPVTSGTFVLEVLSIGWSGQCLQRFTHCSDYATVYERQYFSGEWHEWECLNPPMLEGVEYRTKERYLGKTVYTKTISFGALPNAENKLVEHGISGVTQVIRCTGQMSDGNSLPFHYANTNWVEIHAGPKYVVIRAGNDKSNMTAYAQIWYIKD